MEKRAKKHNTYREGGEARHDDHAPAPSSSPAKDASWTPDRPGQGGKGLSDGYGGSGGQGTGPSGPQTKSVEPDAEKVMRKRRDVDKT